MGSRRFSLRDLLSTLSVLMIICLGSASVADAQRRHRGRRARPAHRQAAPATPAADDDADDDADQPATAAAGQRGASAPAVDNGVCISPRASQSVAQCPSNAPAHAAASTGTAPASHLRTAEVQTKETKKQGPTGPSITIDSSTAQNREQTQARAFTILQREVQILRRLVQNTRANNPQRPDILLRLAETYFEMQQSLTARVRSFDDPIYQACRVQKNAQNCTQARGSQRTAQAALDESRQQAIQTYAILVRDHPDYRRMDEVLFSLAFALDELQQRDRARQVYHRLIKGYPQSRFIPNAYLSFAEFFFQDGDMAAAQRFYEKVTEFPPEQNRVYGYALYKTAWAAYNQQDFRGALQKFVEVVEFATQNPDATDAANLARQARRELILPYAQVGTPGRALEFFRRYASNDAEAIEMLEHLGELYFDTGQWPEAIGVYHSLMSENANSDKLCYWQAHVTNAVISSRPKAEQSRELQRLVDVYDAYTAASGHAADALLQCKAETAQTLAWLATAWHREAIGTDTQPGTNDRGTMTLASGLYQLLLSKFPDMGDLEYPDIDRRDWPTAYKVSYYYAELLWKMEDWARCGPAYDTVVEMNPQGEFTSDAAYASVICYNNLYQQQYQGRERDVRGSASSGRRGRRGRRAAEPEDPQAQYRQRDFTALEQGMINAFRRYRCFVPDSEDLATIKYREARIYYESNHYEEAAVLFRDIALNNTDSDLAEYAANLYLDSLNVMGAMREPHRLSCILEIKDNIEPLFAAYCSTAEKLADHETLCGTLQQLRCDVLRKEAEGLQEQQNYKRAASTYVRIFRRFQECGRLDEVLYNAALNFEAAHLLGRAIQVRKVLITRYADSEWAKRAVYLVGANFHALAFYDQAADYYEQFARRFPGEDGHGCTDAEREGGTCAIASEALQNAVFFRLGLNQPDKAEADVALFARNYKRSLPRQTSEVVFALGSIYERAESWSRVIEHYNRYLRDYRRTAMPHQLISANLKIAMAYWSLDRKDDAKRFFEAAAHAWEGTPEAINALDGTQGEKVAWLREAVDSTAQSLFYLAEYKFAEFQTIHFPRYSGGRSLDRVNQWAQTEFMAWIQAKQTALQATETEYNKVAALRVPVTDAVTLESPPWQIAAAARIGQMYISIIDAVQDAPVPEEIEADPELYDIYVDAFDGPLEPVRVQAISKFEFCLRTATNVRWFNEYSTICESELNRLNPRQYPVAAELRGAPSYMNAPLGDPGAVELSTGDDEDTEPATDAASPAGGAS